MLEVFACQGNVSCCGSGVRDERKLLPTGLDRERAVAGRPAGPRPAMVVVSGTYVLVSCSHPWSSVVHGVANLCKREKEMCVRVIDPEV